MSCGFPDNKLWYAARAFVALDIDLNILKRIVPLDKKDYSPVIDRAIALKNVIDEFPGLNDELCRQRLNDLFKEFP